MVESETSNLKITGSNPAKVTDRHGSPVHPVVNWVPSIWTVITALLFDLFAPIIISVGVMMSTEWIYYRNVQIQSKGKVMWLA